MVHLNNIFPIIIEFFKYQKSMCKQNSPRSDCFQMSGLVQNFCLLFCSFFLVNNFLIIGHQVKESILEIQRFMVKMLKQNYNQALGVAVV